MRKTKVVFNITWKILEIIVTGGVSAFVVWISINLSKRRIKDEYFRIYIKQ